MDKSHLTKLIPLVALVGLIALLFFYLYLTGIIGQKQKLTLWESLPEITDNKYEPETIEIAYLATSQTGTATRAITDGQFILQLYSDIKTPLVNDQKFYVWLSSGTAEKEEFVKLGYLEIEEDGYHFNYQSKKNLITLPRITITINNSGDTTPGNLVMAGQFR